MLPVPSSFMRGARQACMMLQSYTYYARVSICMCVFAHYFLEGDSMEKVTTYNLPLARSLLIGGKRSE